MLYDVDTRHLGHYENYAENMFRRAARGREAPRAEADEMPGNALVGSHVRSYRQMPCALRGVDAPATKPSGTLDGLRGSSPSSGRRAPILHTEQMGRDFAGSIRLYLDLRAEARFETLDAPERSSAPTRVGLHESSCETRSDRRASTPRPRRRPGRSRTRRSTSKDRRDTVVRGRWHDQ